MNFPKLNNNNETFSPSKQQQPQFNLHQSLTTLQTQFSNLLQNLDFLNPNHLETHLTNLKNNAKLAFDSKVSTFSAKTPVWARIPNINNTQLAETRKSGLEILEQRLAGVPVYALSNSADEFVLVSGLQTGKSVGLFCFKKEDAETLLEQMRSMDLDMRSGSRVVAVALNKICQLKVDGVSFKLIPESAQIKNALRERQKAGLQSHESFSGVPVFQSRSLILKNGSKRYRPVFFRKEDLENSLLRASKEQNKLNPVFREGDVHVAALEDIIKGLKENSTSEWNDVVFIPPGFDVSTVSPPKIDNR